MTHQLTRRSFVAASAALLLAAGLPCAFAEEAKKAGGMMKVAEFVRFEKGEGLQKREDNFADEVAGMMK